MYTNPDASVSVDPDSWTVVLKPLAQLTSRCVDSLHPLARMLPANALGRAA